MIIVKHVKMLVPSELLYAFDPTSEDLFIIARERGRLTARPVSECGFLPECGLRNDYCTSTHKFNMTSNRNYDRRCIACPCYDDLHDRCRHDAHDMEDE